MLETLRIRDLALLDEVELELGPGLTVITGETGAGKSILVDALSLLRGARGSAELVRAGASRAVVEAQIAISPGSALQRGLVERELPAGDALVIQRSVLRGGRSRALLQGELSTLSVLGDVGAQLIDICSQHEHQSLTQPTRHRDLLDAFGHLEGDLAAYAAAHEQWANARRALESLRQRASERTKHLDYLRFQLDELEDVSPRVGEYAQLSQRAELLQTARHWMELAGRARNALYEDDDSVCARLALLAEQARRGQSCSPHLAELAERLVSAELAARDAAQVAVRLLDELELDPAELSAAQERLFRLEDLRRKHGVDADELPARRDAVKAEVDELSHADERAAELEERVQALHAEARRQGLILSERRRAAAARLTQALGRELGDLSLPGARLVATVETPAQAELSAHGLDEVELMFSANPGEPLAPLSRVASGGELSRVLLALKSVLAHRDEVGTYVFDEVDAGIGGAVAEAIGRRLAAVAQHRQVLCITHLPQVAAFADVHYRVQKRVQGGRTRTEVTTLDEAGIVDELARMLAGEQVTASARAHAKELRTQARRARTKRSAAHKLVVVKGGKRASAPRAKAS